MLDPKDRDLLARSLAELAWGHNPERVALRQELVARLQRDDIEIEQADGILADFHFVAGGR